MKHNKLTPGEAERLALLIEECAEVQKAATKILRNGYDNFHPDTPELDNRLKLETEIGHVLHAVDLMASHGDLLSQHILLSKLKKAETIKDYLYHQEEDR